MIQAEIPRPRLFRFYCFNLFQGSFGVIFNWFGDGFSGIKQIMQASIKYLDTREQYSNGSAIDGPNNHGGRKILGQASLNVSSLKTASLIKRTTISIIVDNLRCIK